MNSPGHLLSKAFISNLARSSQALSHNHFLASSVNVKPVFTLFPVVAVLTGFLTILFFMSKVDVSVGFIILLNERLGIVAVTVGLPAGITGEELTAGQETGIVGVQG
jgi:hypothetical protein